MYMKNYNTDGKLGNSELKKVRKQVTEKPFTSKWKKEM